MPENLPETLGELIESGYTSRTVKEEIRSNLVQRISDGSEVFPGIVGFDDSVIPQIQNAILAGQDIILLGERGQAKSRIIRLLVDLLDEYIPFVKGSEINDDPLDPISQYGIEALSADKKNTKIDWLPKEDRYAEKLATPDVSVADLIGEIDPIKVAEGRYLSDTMAIHYGMIPRTNRGLFCINELPDLTERIQVSLFNLMQERDIQIKGHQVRLPLDMIIVATANPEDYTNRGRIITPLKDRYGAQIRTHYPSDVSQEMNIVNQEYKKFSDSAELVKTPEFMKEIIGEITHLARRSPEINQRSGVSLRVSISNFETLIGQAFRRSLVNNSISSPRISDLPYLIASTIGKIELETVEEGLETKIISDIVDRAVLNVFTNHTEADEFDFVLNQFEEGIVIQAGNTIDDDKYISLI
ncbi:MAG: sigma 54-interacting transcriptional regulator, partial [Chloroflexota bacterium]|nr:sigma 54-interacting transcriptional regulator [Chloroflexota bacterium]